MKHRAVLILVVIALAACVGRPAEDATGEEIYLQICSNCHGDRLEGGIGSALGPGSNSAGLPDEFLVMAIVDGRGRMPSFRSTLTEPQVERLVGFIREEQG